MNDGWIKLHRKIKDNWIWNDPEKCVAWLSILLSVNHKDKEIIFNGHPMKIRAGQRLTSLSKLANEWGWTRNRVDRFLRTLTETEMLTADRTPNGTLLTVMNWAFYQGQQDSERDSKRDDSEATYEATNGTPVKHKQEYIKNDKNDKNDKEEREGQAPRSHFVPSFDFVEGYCVDHHLKLDVERFMAYYGAREWTLGNGMKVKTKDQLINLIKSWATSVVAKDEEKKTSDGLMPYHEVSQGTARLVGVDVPFEGGLVAEMIRRKRAKNV